MVFHRFKPVEFPGSRAAQTSFETILRCAASLHCLETSEIVCSARRAADFLDGFGSYLVVGRGSEATSWPRISSMPSFALGRFAAIASGYVRR